MSLYGWGDSSVGCVGVMVVIVGCVWGDCSICGVIVALGVYVG